MLKKAVHVGVFIVIFAAFVGFGGVVYASQPTIPKIPAIHINVPESPFVYREVWQDGIISLSYSDYDFGATAVRVRGRGNSTWWLGEDKRPLRFRFNEARSVLGSEYAARDWILLAENFDRSLLRNYAALTLGARLGGMSFVPSAQHVHLYVNGEYMGVYLLTDERNTETGRLDIQWHSEPSLSDFFVELDFRAYRGGIYGETFVVVNDRIYDIRYPSSERRRTPAHIVYVRRYLEAVSYTLRYGTFEEAMKLIDLDSFVDFYIVQEVVKNPDAYYTSVFTYITGEGGNRRLFMGPLWDFDLAAGNVPDWHFSRDPQHLYVAVLHYWYRNLMTMPEFVEAVVIRWNEVRDTAIAETITHIRDTAETYKDEFERNFERHQVMGTPLNIGSPEIQAIDTFDGQVEYLINWLETRVAWLDNFFISINLDKGLTDALASQMIFDHFQFHRNIDITINGEHHQLTIRPIILQGRTMVEVGEIANIFGAEVYEESDAIYMLRGDTVFINHIGSSTFTVNGVCVEADVSSVVMGGYVFLPLRLTAEVLGYQIEWDGSVILGG
ncbi:MAG: CotH kinase family protein [Defluviitaleaceae bacterium]|nr:CotH kinase family protein [Defluviitaleaceae bacterium]